MRKEFMYDMIEGHYRQYSQHLVTIYSAAAGSRQNGEDVVQESYARALAYCGTFDPEEGTFFMWFKSIIRNCLRDKQRDVITKGQGTNTDDLTENQLEQFSEPAKQFDETLMKQLIEQRSPPIQRVLKLSILHGYTAEQVSQLVPQTRDNIWKILERFRNETKTDLKL